MQRGGMVVLSRVSFLHDAMDVIHVGLVVEVEVLLRAARDCCRRRRGLRVCRLQQGAPEEG